MEKTALQRRNGHKKEKDANVQVREGKRSLFSYPSIPLVESITYAGILVLAIAYAWYKIFELSSSNLLANSRAAPFSTTHLWWIGERRKDISNYEWYYWSIWVKEAAVFYCLHFVLFNCFRNVLKTCLWKTMMIFYWFVACFCLFSPSIVALTLVLSIIMLLAARYLRSKLILWFIVLALLFAFVEGYIEISESELFRTVSFIGYKMIHSISYCIYVVDTSAKHGARSFMDDFVDMLWYLYYFPYQLSLIVIYPKFRTHMDTIRTRERNWLEAIWFGVRIMFWYSFIELLLHFMYFDAAIADRDLLKKVPLDTLSSLGLMIGQFFHLKYVVIFGFPAFFAKLDNMIPPGLPICITRVSVFSNVWRYFDRGLYDFFKEYIFLAIARPSFSVMGRLTGLFLSFLFVLVWHGFRHNCIIWVALNVVEILIENIAKQIYAIGSVKRWREENISDRAFRRILAVLQLLLLVLGFYSNFYFIGGSLFGGIVVDRIFWGETVPKLKMPAILLLSLGYCYNHVNMDASRWMSSKSDDLRFIFWVMMVLRRLLYQLMNNEEIIRKISDSRLVRQLARLTAYTYLKVQMKVTEHSRTLHERNGSLGAIQARLSAIKRIGDRFVSNLREEWKNSSSSSK
uniref:MBOAT family protein n=1 Tax=Trichuris muris TaxID=70415 RepID=A0A5S6QAW6_TRIMR